MSPGQDDARAAACVAAMEGIADPDLARRLLEALATHARTIKWRDYPELDEEREMYEDDLEAAAGEAAKMLWGEHWDYEPTEEDEEMMDALRGEGA